MGGWLVSEVMRIEGEGTNEPFEETEMVFWVILVLVTWSLSEDSVRTGCLVL